jgi:hypothetical protein
VTGVPLLVALVTRGVVVMVDDGGLRCMSGLTRFYLPFTAIESASVDRNFSGDTRLVLRMREGKPRVRKLRTEGQASSGVLEAVLHGLERAAKQGSAAAPARSLDGLVANIDARHAGGDAYRGAALASVRLTETFLDRSAPTVERAAAGYELLAYGSPPEGGVVVSALSSLLPPIVLVTLGRVPGAEILLHELVPEALPYVAQEDRDAFVRHLAASGAPSAAASSRIASAIEAALAADETKPVLPANTRTRLRRARTAASNQDPMVGRTFSR